ncbi:MAG TPA: hypothetical protein VMH36_02425 [Alphaproteobacteria bacterium]|nr:hypothetical protein [Alphaproteobacteria bacterium]
MAKIAKIREKISVFIGELLGGIVGWFVCLFILAGMYGLGTGTADYLDWPGNHEPYGILSALAFIWFYERRLAQERYDKLWEIISTRISR